MDIVTLTDAALGMTRLPVRIIEIVEQEDSFKVTAEDAPIGIASAARYVHDNGLRWQQIISQTPLSCAAPIIFEMPSRAVGDGLHMGIAVGGQTSDPLYGGCRVWLSLDGTNYKAEGVIYGSSRYGTISAALAAHAAGTDTTSTVAAALRSNAQLVSGSVADRDKGTTLINVGGEYLSYQTATLASTNNYNLTSLNRGLYGTTPAGAASGATFVRVDDAIAVLEDLNLSLIGQTVFIKCTAFDVYRTAEQDLSAATAYSYTITGNMKALETPVDFATQVGGSGKPEKYATGSDNTVFNSALLSDTTGWTLSSGITRSSTTANPIAAWFNFDLGYGLDAYANNHAMIPLNGVGNLFVSTYRSVAGSLGSGGFVVAIDYFDASFALLSGSSYYLDLNAGAFTYMTFATGKPAVPANATYYTARYSSNFYSGFGRAGALRVARTQDAADITVQNTPTQTATPSKADFTASVAGVTDASQLPFAVQMRRSLGTVDVTTSTSWTATFNGCTGTIGAATGTISITAVATSGSIEVSSARAGEPNLISTISVSKTNAAAGTPGATTVITGSSSATYGAANTTLLTITASASGIVTCSAPLSVKMDSAYPVGYFGAAGKWQWRIAGGVFADVAAEVTTSSPGGSEAQVYDEPPVQNIRGILPANTSKSGLTAGGAYEFQLLLRTAGSGDPTRTRNFVGTASIAIG
jgi:hypothetical protein